MLVYDWPNNCLQRTTWLVGHQNNLNYDLVLLNWTVSVTFNTGDDQSPIYIPPCRCRQNRTQGWGVDPHTETSRESHSILDHYIHVLHHWSEHIYILTCRLKNNNIGKNIIIFIKNRPDLCSSICFKLYWSVPSILG